jgi:hypothetical protein
VHNSLPVFTSQKGTWWGGGKRDDLPSGDRAILVSPGEEKSLAMIERQTARQQAAIEPLTARRIAVPIAAN